MSLSATLVFPHQLFRPHPAMAPGRPVYLIEEWLFFRQYRFHKKKLQLHRASMKAYADALPGGTTVHYTEATRENSDVRRLITKLGADGTTELHLADPVDDWLMRRVQQSAANSGIRLVIYPSPNFLNDPAEMAGYFSSRTGKSKTYFLADFYTSQRKKRNWLLNKSGGPEGGKWSFDTENRKRIPASQKLPFLSFPGADKYISEAAAYVSAHFPDNYGDLSPLPGGGFYPVAAEEAERWLDQFLSERLSAFGPYQDAMKTNEHFLFHSVLTPALNIGLIDPGTLLKKMLTTVAEKKIPLASAEGFLRQVSGWREFIRLVYVREGRKQRTRHFWGFTRKIPPSFRAGSTGIVPVDAVMRKLSATGYAHHIERLMVLGSFMLLCEFDPDEVYVFFMECFIDAYDWVMVPNVYGMSQFADGGLMSTKPYISASHYLLKMGDWEKGPWEKSWDGLFWRFLSVHREFFSRQPRWKMLITQWDEMDKASQSAHLDKAAAFLKKMDSPAGHPDSEETRQSPGLF